MSILPPEILGLVFLIARDLTNGSDFLRDITRVSSRWETSALGCPSLWNQIYIPSPIEIEDQLARSGALPLELNASSSPVLLDSIIQRYSARWHRIIMTTDGPCAAFLRALPVLQLSVLRTLSLTTNDVRHPMRLDFSAMPALNSLLLKNFNLRRAPDVAARSLPPTLARLVLILCTTDVSWWENVSLLCPKLETLGFLTSESQGMQYLTTGQLS